MPVLFVEYVLPRTLPLVNHFIDDSATKNDVFYASNAVIDEKQIGIHGFDKGKHWAYRARRLFPEDPEMKMDSILVGKRETIVVTALSEDAARIQTLAKRRFSWAFRRIGMSGYEEEEFILKPGQIYSIRRPSALGIFKYEEKIYGAILVENGGVGQRVQNVEGNPPTGGKAVAIW